MSSPGESHPEALVEPHMNLSTRRDWRSRPMAFEGCHVTRDIPSLIGKGRLNIEQLDAGYLAPFPKSGSYC